MYILSDGSFQDHASSYFNAVLFSLLYSILDIGSQLLERAYSSVMFFSVGFGLFKNETQKKSEI